MPDPLSDLVGHLAENAEAVCRHYLSNGRRAGRYWLTGDIHNTPGRSLYVCLQSHRAGRWTDAATLEHGDLLDLIAATGGLGGIAAARDEARRFLGLAAFAPLSSLSLAGAASISCAKGAPPGLDQDASVAVARRLFWSSQPIGGTPASRYLAARGIVAAPERTALRCHPRCWYRPEREDAEPAWTAWPTMIAAVTDLEGVITGVHRTWLEPSGRAKAPVATPRRALGHLLGHAVRFGSAGDVLAAGEGIETVLSLRQVIPALPLAAALSATHLAAIQMPSTLRRLYIARDNDAAGDAAVARLIDRASAAGIETIILSPRLGDFNDDLRTLGIDALHAAIRAQLAPEDVARFRAPAVTGRSSR